MSVAAQRDADPLDTRVVKALGHPTRVRILGVLRDRELASPVELSSELDVALGTIGYHVRRLEELGFIELARRTQRRGAVEHHYRARQLLDEDPAPIADAPAGLGAGHAGEALAVARAAQAALAGGGFDAVLARADRRVLRLDAAGEAALDRLLAGWERTVARISRASARRVARAGEPTPHCCTAVVMSFQLPGGGDAS